MKRVLFIFLLILIPLVSAGIEIGGSATDGNGVIDLKSPKQEDPILLSNSTNSSAYWGNYFHGDYDMPTIKLFAYNQTLGGDNRFLKLDTSNNPLTGDLEISKATPLLRLTNTNDASQSIDLKYNDVSYLEFLVTGATKGTVGLANRAFTTGANTDGILVTNDQKYYARDSDIYFNSPSDSVGQIAADGRMQVLSPLTLLTSSATNTRLRIINTFDGNVLGINFTAGQIGDLDVEVQGGDIDFNDARADFGDGNVTANYFIGNGSQLTDVCLSDGTNCMSQGNIFDQSLNTTDNVIFNSMNATTEVAITPNTAILRFGDGGAADTLLFQGQGTSTNIVQFRRSGSASNLMQIVYSDTTTSFTSQATTSLTFSSQVGDLTFGAGSAGKNVTFSTTNTGYVKFFAANNNKAIQIATLLELGNKTGTSTNLNKHWTLDTATTDELHLRNSSDASITSFFQDGKINMSELPTGASTATSMYVCWDNNGLLFLNETGC